MNKDEALKMAIEALAEFEWIKDSKYQKAINACKEALEQPTVAELNNEYLRDTNVIGLEQQEGKKFFERGKEIARWADKQPAQEPVGYYHPDERSAYLLFKKGLIIPRDTLPLYANPYQWQGLTDNEIDNIYDNCQKVLAKINIEKLENNALETFLNGIKNAIKTAIFETEQALKEKNT